MELDSNSSRHAIFAVLVAFWGATSVAGASETFGRSFVDHFDTLDEARGYKSDGWTNGPHQRCWWSGDHALVAGGRLTLTMEEGGLLDPDLCAEVQTRETYGYGVYEARMRGSSGSGLVSAFFTYTGPPLGVPRHDEIDFELLGQNSREMQLNFYSNGKGDHETYVDLGFDAGSTFATYAFDWQPDSITWYVNGRQVHQVKGRRQLPSHPGKIFFSLWAGTSEVNDWLGPFAFPARPPSVEIEWVAYTAPGEPCQFAGSVACR
jgi:endo-1,3-1,4-beta-glycanase ExoK